MHKMLIKRIKSFQYHLTISESSVFGKRDFNPFPNKPWFLRYKFFENTVGKGDDNFKFDENGRKFSRRVENPVGKKKLLLFPRVFSKDLYCRHIKTRSCL